MSERFWSVRGYDSDTVVFDRSISVDDIAESEVKALLQRLAARALSEEEVVAASMDKSEARTACAGRSHRTCLTHARGISMTAAQRRYRMKSAAIQ